MKGSQESIVTSKIFIFEAFTVTMFFMTALATNIQAQEIEPRAYSNAPVGVNFLIVSYAYAEGGFANDPSLPVTTVDGDM